jgi:hypothetical protein
MIEYISVETEWSETINYAHGIAVGQLVEYLKLLR